MHLEAIEATRPAGVFGATSMVNASPCRAVISSSLPALPETSRSGTISPSKPDSAARATNRSGPIRSTMDALTIATSAWPVSGRRLRTVSKTACGVTPQCSASCIEAAITGPSAIGSEKGIPNSTTVGPRDSSNAPMTAAVA